MPPHVCRPGQGGGEPVPRVPDQPQGGGGGGSDHQPCPREEEKGRAEDIGRKGPNFGCGDPREEERGRRHSDRLREEEEPFELFGASSREGGPEFVRHPQGGGGGCRRSDRPQGGGGDRSYQVGAVAPVLKGVGIREEVDADAFATGPVFWEEGGLANILLAVSGLMGHPGDHRPMDAKIRQFPR